MRKLAVVAGVVVAAASLPPIVARQRFRARVSHEAATLLSQPGATPVGPEQRRVRADTLPEPVRRYLRFAIRDDAPAVRWAHMRHGGTFRTGPAAGWFPIEGEQFFTAGTPGFVWHALLRPVPLVFWIDARDRLEAGRGNMLVKLLSLVTLADASGPEIDQGASIRWLGEAAWFPYAFVSDAVRWEAIDDRTARASLVADGPPMSGVFEFNDDGSLAGLRADRYRDVGGGRAVLAPFMGRYDGYRDFAGFRVPTSVVVTWRLDEGDFTYARFHVTSIEYN